VYAYFSFTFILCHVLRRVSLLDNTDCRIDLMGERCGQQLAAASRNWVQRMKDELGCVDGLFPFQCTRVVSFSSRHVMALVACIANLLSASTAAETELSVKTVHTLLAP